MRREVVYPTPEHAARGQSAAIRRFSSTFRLPKIRAPTLVATGELDVLVPPGNSRILASNIADARLAVFPKLAHRAIWEAPDELAEFVGDFLVSIDRSE